MIDLGVSLVFFQKKDKFTLLIRRRTISAASKLGFDESKSRKRGVFRKILQNEDARVGRHIYHLKFQDFDYISRCLEGTASYSELVRLAALNAEFSQNCTHFRGVNRDRLSTITTQVGLICLQSLMDLMNDTDGFSIALDGSRWKRRKHIGIRLRFYTGGSLHSFFLGHLSISDTPATKTATEHVFDNVSELLDLMYDSWKSKIVGVTTDGARDMLGIYNGIQKRFKDVATHKLICVWCGCHQLDVELSHRYKDKYFSIGGKLWTATLDRFVTLLRKHTSFESQCPSRADTRWYVQARDYSNITHSYRKITTKNDSSCSNTGTQYDVQQIG